MVQVLDQPMYHIVGGSKAYIYYVGDEWLEFCKERSSDASTLDLFVIYL